jgi:hypothetical protein
VDLRGLKLRARHAVAIEQVSGALQRGSCSIWHLDSQYLRSFGCTIGINPDRRGCKEIMPLSNAISWTSRGIWRKSTTMQLNSAIQPRDGIDAVQNSPLFTTVHAFDLLSLEGEDLRRDP